MDSFEAGVADVLEREEILLAKLAELAGSGMDERGIARCLGISIGLVRDILRSPRSGGIPP